MKVYEHCEQVNVVGVKGQGKEFGAVADWLSALMHNTLNYIHTYIHTQRYLGLRGTR